MRTGCIYLITNLINGKQYVGQTLNFKRRMMFHKTHDTTLMDRVIQKYGWENFSSSIIEDNVPENELNEREKYWIKYFNTFEGEGYNCTEGGQFGMYGENHPNTDLDPQTCIEIYKKCKYEGKTIRFLSREYGVSRRAVGRIVYAEHWATEHLPPVDKEKLHNRGKKYCARKGVSNGRAKVTKEMGLEIYYRYRESDEDLTYQDIQEEYGIGTSTIRTIVNNHHWTTKEM
jgi:group I intron endonuclease